MRKSVRNIALFVLLFALVLGMTACGSKTGEIKNLTADFEKACNELDLNAMLDCINPAVADGVKLATGFVGMFTDKDTDEVLDGVASLLLDEAPDDAKAFFSSIKITTKEIEVDGENATATATIEYTVSGEDYDEEAVFQYLYTDEQWYISDLSFQ